MKNKKNVKKVSENIKQTTTCWKRRKQQGQNQQGPENIFSILCCKSKSAIATQNAYITGKNIAAFEINITL